MKTLYAASVMVATSILASSAQAGQVETAWDLFTQKCQQFLDNPAEFLDRSNRNIPSWEWIIREEVNTGFFEYFSVSPGGKKQFTAIRHAGVENDFLHCSLSVVSERSELSETISRHLSTLPDVQQVGGVIDFPNETGMSNDLKRYYSTANRTSLAGVFDSQNVSTQVRVDDVGSFYFEVHAVRPAE
ncbi:hypothetical protein [Roseibium aggregatum]|uniref:hypothetical protein n=1 Tax=Roseibium aggregatum TaxID=187304 RepID=UPI0012F4C349|nr:hypothetical protein [Roseibium aggregatum]